MSQNVYVANTLYADIYVLVSPNPAWQIVDLIATTAFDVISQAIPGLDAVADYLEGFEVVNDMKDVVDVCKILRNAAKIINKAKDIEEEVEEAEEGAQEAMEQAKDKAEEVFKAFANGTKKISAGNVQNVYSTSFLDYLAPSAWAAMFDRNVDNITLTITTSVNGRYYTSTFNTNDDLSWITGHNIVRSKYGTLWQEDPSAGTEKWTPKMGGCTITFPTSEDREVPKGSEWTTKSGYKFIFQDDGNLCHYNPSGQCVWSSGTDNKATYFAIQADGNLVLYNDSGSAASDIVSIVHGDSSSTNSVAWTANIGGENSAYLAIQEDGNVVVYSTDNKVLWATGTNGK